MNSSLAIPMMLTVILDASLNSVLLRGPFSTFILLWGFAICVFNLQQKFRPNTSLFCLGNDQNERFTQLVSGAATLDFYHLANYPPLSSTSVTFSFADEFI